MRSSRSIELFVARSSASGATFFSEPLASDETLIAEVRHSEHGELFCHRFQTDQLQVISGSLDLIVLQDRRLRCIHLRDDEPMWLRIAPVVPHGAINRSSRPAVVVNAVLRHGASDLRDDQPRAIPRALGQMWSNLQAA